MTAKRFLVRAHAKEQRPKRFAIKVRQKGQEQWAFITPKGGMNDQPVYAALYETRAQAQAVINANCGVNRGIVEWRVQQL